MKQLYIYCDGGFGNRFNSLISGLIISNVGNFDPVILWPSTHSCRSEFGSIFESRFNVINETLHYFLKDQSLYAYFMHGNFLNFSEPIIHPNLFNSIDEFVNHLNLVEKNKLVYNNDSIPNYIDWSFIKKNFLLNFRENIIKESENFIELNSLNEYFGIHLRDTDFHQYDDMSRYDKYYSLINSNKDKKYFVCSDNKELEKRFSYLPNVYIRRKKKYVEKQNTDSQWSNNIERSHESVIESLIDLTILSKSNIIKTSESSFLKTAQLLNFING